MNRARTLYMGRRKRPRMVKKQDRGNKIHCEPTSVGEEATVCLPEESTTEEQVPVASLDLTVTYDYTCEEKNADPVESMEQLSGLFPFKESLHPSDHSSSVLPSALWADFNPHPPPPKRTKSAPAGAPQLGIPQRQHNWRDLVSTIDELKGAAGSSTPRQQQERAGEGGTCWRQDRAVEDHDHWRQERGEEDCDHWKRERAVEDRDHWRQDRDRDHWRQERAVEDRDHWRQDRAVEDRDHWRQDRDRDHWRQERGEDHWRQQRGEEDCDSVLHWKEEKHHQRDLEGPAEKDSSEEDEFWEAAALLVSQETTIDANLLVPTQFKSGNCSGSLNVSHTPSSNPTPQQTVLPHSSYSNPKTVLPHSTSNPKTCAPPPSSSSNPQTCAPPSSSSSNPQTRVPPPSSPSNPQTCAPPPSSSSNPQTCAPPSSSSSNPQTCAPPPSSGSPSNPQTCVPPPSSSSNPQTCAPPLSNPQTPPSSPEGQQYDAHQIELKRLKAVQLLSQRKQTAS